MRGAPICTTGAQPDGPAPIGALVFKGSVDDGSVVEIRSDRSGGLVVDVDGVLVQRLEAKKVPIAVRRPGVFRLEGVEFCEIFNADPAALRTRDDLPVLWRQPTLAAHRRTAGRRPDRRPLQPDPTRPTRSAPVAQRPTRAQLAR